MYTERVKVRSRAERQVENNKKEQKIENEKRGAKAAVSTPVQLEMIKEDEVAGDLLCPPAQF